MAPDTLLKPVATATVPSVDAESADDFAEENDAPPYIAANGRPTLRAVAELQGSLKDVWLLRFKGRYLQHLEDGGFWSGIHDDLVAFKNKKDAVSWTTIPGVEVVKASDVAQSAWWIDGTYFEFKVTFCCSIEPVSVKVTSLNEAITAERRAIKDQLKQSTEKLKAAQRDVESFQTRLQNLARAPRPGAKKKIAPKKVRVSKKKAPLRGYQKKWVAQAKNAKRRRK